MKRSLRANIIPAPDTDDNFSGTPHKITTRQATDSGSQDFFPVLTSSAGDDDDVYLAGYTAMTNPPTVEASTLPPHHHNQQQAPNPLLEVTTILLWIVVVLSCLYYLISEQNRRRRRLRRQRQERLEVYSPKKQSTRRLELVQVLKSTTVTVEWKDLILVNNHGGEKDEEDDYDTDCEKSEQDEGEKNGAEKLIASEETPSINSSEEDEESQDEEEETQQLWCDVGQPVLDLSSSSFDDEEQQEDRTLQLPTCHPKDQRQVPASCSICLKRFRVQEQVTWSPNANGNGCPHAFHQHCIIEWLAKVPDCNCPICRQSFCQLHRSKGKGKGGK